MKEWKEPQKKAEGVNIYPIKKKITIHFFLLFKYKKKKSKNRTTNFFVHGDE